MKRGVLAAESLNIIDHEKGFFKVYGEYQKLIN
jgi:hypothetical protein